MLCQACAPVSRGDSKGTGRAALGRRQVVSGAVPAYEGDTPQPLSSSETQEVCHRKRALTLPGWCPKPDCQPPNNKRQKFVLLVGRRQVCDRSQRDAATAAAALRTAWSPNRKSSNSTTKIQTLGYKAYKIYIYAHVQETVRLRRAQTHYKMQSSSCSRATHSASLRGPFFQVKFLPNILDKLFQKLRR